MLTQGYTNYYIENMQSKNRIPNHKFYVYVFTISLKLIDINRYCYLLVSFHKKYAMLEANSKNSSNIIACNKIYIYIPTHVENLINAAYNYNKSVPTLKKKFVYSNTYTLYDMQNN